MIAVICPIHNNPASVAAQIKNYASVHGDSAVHILHPSIESGNTFEGFARNYRFDCPVLTCNNRLPTNYYTALGAAISATTLLDANLGEITHVYYHTDSDLLVQRGFTELIKMHDNGYRSKIGDERWHPYKAMLQDPRFKKLRDALEIGEDDIRIGRIEGCFFDIAVWKEMFAVIGKYFETETLEDKTSRWPMEACLFPTLARKLLQRDHASTTNLILTKPPQKRDIGKKIRDHDANIVQVDDIVRAIKKNVHKQCFGMKWFSPDLEHPSRKFVAQMI